MSQRQSSERRKTKRIRNRIVTRATTLRDEFNGVVANFSEIGLRVELPKRLKQGNLISLRVEAPRPIHVDGRVIWSEESARREVWNTGIAVASPSAPWLTLVHQRKSEELRSRNEIDERFEVNHDVRTDLPGNPESRTENLSLGGMYLTTGTTLENGATLRAKIRIPGLPAPLEVRGRVVYRLTSQEAEAKGRKPGVGIQFTEIQEESKAHLRHYLRRLTVHRQKPDRRSTEEIPLLGSLADYLVPEILWNLYERKRSGILRLENRKSVKTIYLNRGNPVFVDANERTEAFGPFLLRRGKLTSAQLEASLQEAGDRDIRLGEILLERKILDRSTLADLLIAHQEEKLANTFAWFEGEYIFADRLDWPEGICLLPLRTPRIVVNGVIRWYEPETVSAWMNLTAETIVVRTESPLSRLELPASVSQILQLTASPKNVTDLARLCRLTADDLFPVIFVLVLVGAIRIKSSARWEKRTAEPEAPSCDPRLAERIRKEHERLQGMDFHELLGLHSTPSDVAIDRAFENASAPYRSAELDRIGDPELREKGEQIRGWLRLAHEVLRSPKLRQIHARHALRSENKENRDRRIAAERLLLAGIGEIERNDFHSAVATLTKGAERFPEEVAIAGYLAWALFNQDRELNLPVALENLDRALSKERTDAALWYYRGEICRHRGNEDDARRCFERATRLDPAFEAPRSALRETQRKAENIAER
jgi:tetratricopeptide (TPR) repeat protein/Tfp pilus assembly protein PilZ